MVTIWKINERFSAAHIGRALADMWTVSELTLRLVPFLDECGKRLACPVTLETITNPGMIQDGGVYQMGFIMSWLSQQDRSPLTNLTLQHTDVFLEGRS